jgi:hypothetical protein
MFVGKKTPRKQWHEENSAGRKSVSRRWCRVKKIRR